MGLNSPEAYQEAVRIGAIPVEMYSIEQLFPGYDPAYAQGGRVGFYGGGYSDILREDEDDYIRVADVSQSAINAIRTTLKVPGMGGMSPSEVKQFTPGTSHLTNKEVEEIMDGTIDEPTGKYEILNAEDPFNIFSPGTWF